MNKIKVIGIGGIGGCLLPLLARYSNFSLEQVEITLVDGDRFEEKNATRQKFESLGNKAEVVSTALQKEFLRVVFNSRPLYLTTDNIVENIRENDVIFLCVDNHATRKLVSDRCEELDNVVLFSGGNELTDGNVQIFIRKDGENITLPLTSSYHPEIQFPSDDNPAEGSCESLAESEPQILFTNNAIAAAMLNAYFAHSEGKLRYDEVYIDIITNNVRQVNRSNAGA